MGVVKRQGIKNTISSYFGILIGFASLIVIQPKLLPPEVIGLSRVLFAFSTLIGTLIPLGAGNICIRYFPRFFNAKEKHHGFFGFIMLFPLAGSFLVLFTLFLFKEWIIAKYASQSPLFETYFYLVFPFCVFMGLTSLLSVYLSALYKSTVPAYISDIVVRLLYVLLILLFYFEYLTLTQFMIGYVFIYFLQLIALSVYLIIVGDPSFKIDWPKLKSENIKEMTYFGFYVSVAGFASLGLNTIDAIILGAYGLTTLGIYTVVAFIPTIIQTPLNALDRISAPKIAFALHENDTKELTTIYYKSCKYLFLIGLYLAVMINLNIASLLSMIKPEYLAALPIVPIVSIGYVLNMLGGTSITLLFYSGKKWESALLLMTAFIITAVLDLLLIPKLGMVGAAYSISITAFLFTILKWYLVKRKFDLQPYDFSFVQIGFTGVVVFLVGYFIPKIESPILSILVIGSVGTLVYALLVYTLKIVSIKFENGKLKID
jgi:O-antigen/teichoic acid export membrane protein